MKRVGGWVVLFLSLFGVWILVTASLGVEEVLVGLLVALILTLSIGSARELFSGVRFTPKAIVFAPVYLIKFLVQLIKANIDVARRVLSPSLPINPGIVRVNTKLSSPLGKLILANSITLTPGTLTLDVRGEDMYIHWIDVRGEDEAAATASIVRSFEKTLREVVE